MFSLLHYVICMLFCHILGTTKILMDNKEFESDCYQRVYQYLRRHAANLNLDTFSYPGTVEASPTECLNVLQK